MKDYKELIERLADCATDCHELMLEAADEIEEMMPLERDKAKTPYAESDGYADGAPVWDYFCPTCNEPFEDSQPKYCPNCGQKILWEGEE